MRLVMAGGGTGGHLFPLIALAEEFKRRDESAEIVFIGTRGRIEEKVVPGLGFRLDFIEVEAIKNKGKAGKIKALGVASTATLKSVKLLRSIKPDGIIGSGSYASGPVLLAGKILGIKTALLEQNVAPGMTNKYLSKFVGRSYVAFEGTGQYFPKSTLRVMGTPIREGIAQGGAKVTAGERDKKFTILVVGGSQGASSINRAFVEAAGLLSEIWSDISVIHQSGEGDYADTLRDYKEKGLEVELNAFINDMAGAYSKADLVICRAGATTIAEITSLGLASVMVPYPYAAAGHQEVNARYLEEAGASVMLTEDGLTGASLAETIRGFYDDRVALELMAEKAKGLARTNAAKLIVDDFTMFLSNRS